jgi:polysaccharide export outer membrane protein
MVQTRRALLRGGMIAAAGLALSGCRTLSDRPQAVAPAFEAPYDLDAGDRLRILVFGQETLSNTYTVDAGGHVTMPLIGAVKARGRTLKELSDAIAARLRQGFIRDPSVAVEIETYRPFFILGEVTQPGQYPYVAQMTAQTAIAIAGGFTPRAVRSSVEITRHVGGELVRARVPVAYPLRPGDTIVVSERWF